MNFPNVIPQKRQSFFFFFLSILSVISRCSLVEIKGKNVGPQNSANILESENCPVVSNSLWSHGLYSPWNSPGQITGVGSLSLLQGIFPTRDQTRSPALQVGSLPAGPPRKPKNTGMGSLSLLQQIFSTQESNQGLLHCKQILYKLSYQGSPANIFTLRKGWLVRSSGAVLQMGE